MKTYKVTVSSNGNIRFFNKKGEYHCEHGPAVIYYDGSKHWFQNNKYHRLDGPAIEYANGYKGWFIEGKEYTQAEFKKKVKELKNPKPSYDGKIVTIEGKQYKLTEI